MLQAFIFLIGGMLIRNDITLLTDNACGSDRTYKKWPNSLDIFYVERLTPRDWRAQGAMPAAANLLETFPLQVCKVAARGSRRRSSLGGGRRSLKKSTDRPIYTLCRKTLTSFNVFSSLFFKTTRVARPGATHCLALIARPMSRRSVQKWM